jgi:hypothetical protein
MPTARSKELSRAIREHGRSHTPWSGPIDMLDGYTYYGTVWRLTREHPGLYVYYRNHVYRV